MASRGKMAYVPKIVIEELEDIMQEKQINVGANGFRKMVEYSRVGREVERIITLKPRKKRGGLF